MQLLARDRRIVPAAVFGLLLLLAWLAYAPALGGSFLLDDRINLEGLKNVDDTTSALQFVLSGISSPIGRPVALASFLPHADAYESGARSLIAANIALHLVNACLLALLFYRLAVAHRIDARRSAFVAVAAATIWLFMPLLASTSLMVVQRMTSLSATFVFAGLIGYLAARQDIDRAPRASIVGMTAALVIGTLLAVLTKENGALLPVFVLALEATVLPRPKTMSRTAWRTWTAVFLALPTVLLLAYLATRLPYPEPTMLRRDFTGWQRLLTESRILWEYLFNAFIPRADAFGPFHDGYPVARTLANPVTVAAVLGWVAVIALAIRLRRREPLVSVAILWFVGGHLLESTTIPLELYFEHRNYVPIAGPVFAVCALTLRLPHSARRLVYAAAPLYVLVNAFVLFGQASVWGNPPLAGQEWHQRFPHSLRATMSAVSYPTSDDWAQQTFETLDRFVEQHPEDGYLKILELDLSCSLFPSVDHGEMAREVRQLLGSVHFTYNTVTMLLGLHKTESSVDCKGVDTGTVRSLAETLMQNPRYGTSTVYSQMHHKLMARLAKEEGDYDEAIRHIELAMEQRPDADLNMMMVTTLVETADYEDARHFIRDARKKAPQHPFRRYAWLSRLDGLARYVEAAANAPS